MAISTPIPGPPPAGTTSSVNIFSSAGLQNIGEVVVEAVPPKLQLLARTILLTGTVIIPLPPDPDAPPQSAPPANVITLRTPAGEVTIRISTPIPTDQVLTLQIPPGAPPVRAQVFITPTPAQVAADRATVQGVATPTNKPTAPLVTPALPELTSPAPAQGRPTAPTPSVSAPQSAAPIVPVQSLPLLPGMVVEAQMLALPEPFSAQAPIKLATSPLAQNTQVVANKIRHNILPVKVEALVEMLRHLPISALLASREKEGQGKLDAKPNLAPLLPAPEVPSLTPPTARPIPAATTEPAFASTPNLLALPAGARVTLQVENIIPTEPQDPAQPTQNKTTAAPTAPPIQPNIAVKSTPTPQPALPNAAPLITPQAIEQHTTPPLTAIVIGSTPANEPILTSPAGLFILSEQAPLPVNTKVEFSFIAVDEALDFGDSLQLAPRQYPALHDIMAALAATQPAAHAALAARLPQPATNLGPVALLFLSALKLGDAQGWLGDDAVRKLAAADDGNILARLSGEFTSARPPEQTQSEAWKSFAIPLPADGRMSQFLIHSRREADPAEPTQFGKRFLVEVEFSRLGPMQIDGFLRSKNFDVTLRSQRNLAQSLREELRTTFRTALEAVGCRGGLLFETAAELWLKR